MAKEGVVNAEAVPQKAGVAENRCSVRVEVAFLSGADCVRASLGPAQAERTGFFRFNRRRRVPHVTAGPFRRLAQDGLIDKLPGGTAHTICALKFWL